MKITAGILFYLLDQYKDAQQICHGADRMPLDRVAHFYDQGEVEKGVLYLYVDKEGVLLFCSEEKKQTEAIRMEPLQTEMDNFSSLWIPQVTRDEVSECISQIWNVFIQTQNEILEAVINQELVEAIMDKAKELLKKPFLVVDRDMLLLYDHPEIAARMRKELGDDYSEKVIEELLTAKKFHEVAGKRVPFYYQMKNIGFLSYCVNIVADGYYYARLVVYLEDETGQLPSGAEQITEYVATVLVQMIRGGYLQTHHSQNDHLHMVISRLLNGILPKTEEIREAIGGYSWEENQTYQVICLEPYHAAGWDTQIENTMPAIIRKLEQNWHHSCAAFSGNQIMWVINHSLSAEQTSLYELTQQILVFLRENVLKAGASSFFSDISLLGSAWKQAETALQIGAKTDPNYWYYRFDDYRLSFMIDSIRETEIDPMLLVHPAIVLLMNYDQAHESELLKTLKILVEKRGNVTKAADALFIHRTTLFRRQNQIRDLTKLDLDNGELMLELQLSFQIIRDERDHMR